MSHTVIIPTFNNVEDLVGTLRSVRKHSDCSVVVIDSSDLDMAHAVRAELGQSDAYFWVHPNGVYPAINEGIRRANTDFIQILNSGDMFISDYVCCELDEYDVHIFRQEWNEAGFSGVFSPHLKSVWPHQSVIYRKELHHKFGLYCEELKIVSDQLFFSKLRGEKIKFHQQVLTIYRCDGISSSVTMRNFRELVFFEKKVMGRSAVHVALSVGKMILRGVLPRRMFFCLKAIKDKAS